MPVHEILTKLGFAEYDAKAYVALLREGQSNGYEVAKAAGIPRANVYGVLKRLARRGAVQRFDTDDGTRYVATPSDRLLSQLDQQHKDILNQARQELERVLPAEQSSPVYNLTGIDQLIQRAREEIDATKKELLIAIQPQEAAQLAKQLQNARDRNVRITTLCLEACEKECGGCQGNIHRLPLAPPGSTGWLLLVCDGTTTLIGQRSPALTQGVITSRSLLVELTTAYIRQSLALALLGGELAGRFDGLLSERARETVDQLYPDEDFLASIQTLGRDLT